MHGCSVSAVGAPFHQSWRLGWARAVHADALQPDSLAGPGWAGGVIFGGGAADVCPALLSKPTPDQRLAAFRTRVCQGSAWGPSDAPVLAFWARGPRRRGPPCMRPALCPFPRGRAPGVSCCPSPVTRVCLTCTQTNSSGGTWTPRPGVRGQLTLLPASLAHLPYSVASHHVFAFFLV